MPENNDTGQEVLEYLAMMDETGFLHPDLPSANNISISPLGTTTITAETVMPFNNPYNQYLEWDIDTLHSNLLKNWGISYKSEPVTKLIKEDEDMGTTEIKSSNNKNMKPLEKEEIERAIWKEQPNKFFLKDLLEKGENTTLFAIGKFGSGNINRGLGGNGIYLILGHRLDGVISYTNEQSNKICKTTVKKREYIMYDLLNKKVGLYDSHRVEAYFSSAGNSTILNYLCKYFNYKIIDSTLSGRVFGLGKSKANLVGTTVSNIKLEFGESVRLKDSSWYAIVYNETTKQSVKFCLSDLEIILPSIKGYNFPKDKTINKGSSVVIKTNKQSVYKVLEIYPNPSSQRLRKNCETRKLDVLRVTNITNHLDNHKVYAKNVKLVN